MARNRDNELRTACSRTPSIFAMGPKRPSQTTMEGMLWNANHVLDSALDPSNSGSGEGGIPKDLMEKCHGVVLISVVEAGFIFSGSVGTGVLMAHYPEWGEWSAPSAVSLHGVGFGFFVGKGVRDIVILIMDPTLKEVSGNAEIRFGGDVDHTFTGIGGKDDKVSHGSCDFLRGSHSFVFSQGFFTGASLGSSVLAARNKENERFYGKKATPREIMFEGAVTPPEGSGVSYLHKKLNLLKAGKTTVLSATQSEMKETLWVSANKSAEEAKADQVDELEYVDAEKEAVKESAKKEEEDVEKEAVKESAKREEEGGASDGSEVPAKETLKGEGQGSTNEKIDESETK